MSGGDFEGVTLTNFLILAMIRGSTPLMAYFAVANLNSASLVVSLKCAISLVFFAWTFLWILASDKDATSKIFRNFRDKHTYWKVGLLGLIQGAAPYLLVVYSLQFLPPTLLGVFMAATPWITIILERLPFIKVKSAVTSLVKLGMVLGFAGILFIMVPVLHESEINNKACKLPYTAINSTSTPINLTKLEPRGTRRPLLKYGGRYDTCLSAKELAFGTLALLSGALLWATATVFWRSQKGDIHFSVASLGQNLVAGVLSCILWIILYTTHVVGHPEWTTTRGLVGIVFLGMMTGWLATLLAQYLSRKIGPKPTNQVLSALPMVAFVEDCIFVKSVTTLYSWLIALEVLGLLMISVGAFMTSLPQDKTKRKNSIEDQLISHDYLSEDGLTGPEQDDLQRHIKRYDDTRESDNESTCSHEEEIPTSWRNGTTQASDKYPPVTELKDGEITKA